MLSRHFCCGDYAERRLDELKAAAVLALLSIAAPGISDLYQVDLYFRFERFNTLGRMSHEWAVL
jgi:hypothetical protein